ncbi:MULTISPECIES: dTMP kinase [Rhodococcus]|uniref:Thymidylate kinase n=1 Tax=Rhodococcus jostii TaxID=132919 RepID=A0ABU4CFN3_RHOJO|nr:MULTISPECIES: dTMP kinase [Rhodococcus]MDI9952571.1 dTMP kinase [Rhodococcus sp. IEGM 1305]MDI9978397.1 dTMP kinase [Rhodococcus sp. IEGM 1307]MDV6282361.1 dTMP kinase [Rhodococcus jostii]
MGKLIALEGLDGAGKRTLVGAVVARLTEQGLTVGTLDFPRYGRSVHADLASEALKGAHGDLSDSVHAMAVLFALDRSGAVGELGELLAGHDLVILDRYVASNAAYGAARLHQGADGEFVGWVQNLEFERLGLPRPDLQLYLDVPVALAAQRARGRESADASRSLDAYERDRGLQERTGEVYRELAVKDWISPWWVLTPDTDPVTLAENLALLSDDTARRDEKEHGTP